VHAELNFKLYSGSRPIPIQTAAIEMGAVGVRYPDGKALPRLSCRTRAAADGPDGTAFWPIQNFAAYHRVEQLKIYSTKAGISPQDRKARRR